MNNNDTISSRHKFWNFLVPYGNLLIYLLAISGVASFFVILVNYFGLSTEEKQHIVKDLKEDSDYSKPQ